MTATEVFESITNGGTSDFALHARILAAHGPWCLIGGLAVLTDVVQGKIRAWQDQKRRPGKRKKDELDLMRILEAYREQREAMPKEIREQVLRK